MHIDELLTKDDLKRFKEELFEELRKLDPSQHEGMATKQWLKSCEVHKLLGISPGTLQNLRVNGTLPYTKIGSLMYYRYQDIRKLLDGSQAKGTSLSH